MFNDYSSNLWSSSGYKYLVFSVCFYNLIVLSASYYIFYTFQRTTIYFHYTGCKSITFFFHQIYKLTFLL